MAILVNTCVFSLIMCMIILPLWLITTIMFRSDKILDHSVLYNNCNTSIIDIDTTHMKDEYPYQIYMYQTYCPSLNKTCSSDNVICGYHVFSNYRICEMIKKFGHNILTKNSFACVHSQNNMCSIVEYFHDNKCISYTDKNMMDYIGLLTFIGIYIGIIYYNKKYIQLFKNYVAIKITEKIETSRNNYQIIDDA